MLLKPYAITLNDEDNSAEINLYGEVVDTRPVDLWTGQPMPGNYIALDEFMNDLNQLAAREHITVHINSVGGDMYAGIAIYNRLKSAKASVTTINDGLAASAGSIIFQAGDIRRVNPGSNVMIHAPLGFLYGYYQAGDLRGVIKQLDAHNKACINLYAERTGRPADEIKTLVDRETWMTGKEAVEQGFADEIAGDGADITMSLSPGRDYILVNSYMLPTRCLSNIPDRIPQASAADMVRVAAVKLEGLPPAAEQEDNTKNIIQESEEMEIKNIEELRGAFPDLVLQVEAAAKAEGQAAERARLKGIEEIQSSISDQELLARAKYGEQPLSAEQLAFQAMRAQAVIGAEMLGKLKSDAEKSGARQVEASTAADNPAETEKQGQEAAVNMIVGPRKKREV